MLQRETGREKAWREFSLPPRPERWRFTSGTSDHRGRSDSRQWQCLDEQVLKMRHVANGNVHVTMRGDDGTVYEAGRRRRVAVLTSSPVTHWMSVLSELALWVYWHAEDEATVRTCRTGETILH